MDIFNQISKSKRLQFVNHLLVEDYDLRKGYFPKWLKDKKWNFEEMLFSEVLSPMPNKRYKKKVLKKVVRELENGNKVMVKVIVRDSNFLFIPVEIYIDRVHNNWDDEVKYLAPDKNGLCIVYEFDSQAQSICHTFSEGQLRERVKVYN